MRTTKAATVVILAASTIVSLAGCGMVSDETTEQGKEALCASQEVNIASLKAGGEGARAVASIVRDVTEDGTEIHTVADQVANNSSDVAARERLAGLVDRYCG